MAEVELPAVGKVDRKWIYVGAAAVVGIAAWWFLSGRDKAEAAAVAESDAAFGDAVTGTSGGSGYVNPNPNASGSGAVDSSDGGAIDTLPEWADLVTAKLAELGVDPAYLRAVLGKYLAGQPLTSDEAATVTQAWAYAGKPPGGPANFTLVNDSSTPGTTPTPRPDGPVVPRRPLPPATAPVVNTPVPGRRI